MIVIRTVRRARSNLLSSSVSSFSSSSASSSSASSSASPSSRATSTLILLRHGQSIWNGAEPRFTGWCDVPLTVKGRVEAVGAGQLLRSRGFRASKVDVAFTSELQRAHETCELALASMAGSDQDTWSSDRIRRDWRLNERHYGNVQGLAKNDPELIARFGEAEVRRWRRSMDAKPPVIDSACHEHYQPPPAPLTESLVDCQRRVMECFHTRISEAMFDEGDPAAATRTVVVVAHSNTIRSLMAALDHIPHEDVPQLHVPNGVPILFRFERSSRKLLSTKLQTQAGASHARWLLSPENHAEIRQSLLTRALSSSLFNVDDELFLAGPETSLTVLELEAGIKRFLKDDSHGNSSARCGVIAVAKSIVRGLSADPKRTLTLAEFEALAASSASELAASIRRQTKDDLLGGDVGGGIMPREI